MRRAWDPARVFSGQLPRWPVIPRIICRAKTRGTARKKSGAENQRTGPQSRRVARVRTGILQSVSSVPVRTRPTRLAVRLHLACRSRETRNRWPSLRAGQHARGPDRASSWCPFFPACPLRPRAGRKKTESWSAERLAKGRPCGALAPPGAICRFKSNTNPNTHTRPHPHPRSRSYKPANSRPSVNPQLTRTAHKKGVPRTAHRTAKTPSKMIESPQRNPPNLQ
jgi:hypothetical protein